MAQQTITSPKIVTRQQWLTERKALLKKEKEATRFLDSVKAARRRLPMPAGSVITRAMLQARVYFFGMRTLYAMFIQRTHVVQNFWGLITTTWISLPTDDRRTARNRPMDVLKNQHMDKLSAEIINPD
jgi:hypothetical protein